MTATLDDARDAAVELIGTARGRILEVVDSGSEQLSGTADELAGRLGDLPIPGGDPKKSRRWLKVAVIAVIATGLFVVIKRLKDSGRQPSDRPTPD
jgi:hypothetical protein